MIEPGKLAANSFSILKRIKDNDSSNKILKTGNNDGDLAYKIKMDFSDLKVNDKAFKSRIVNINNHLNEYENEVSKVQYADQKIKLIDNLLEKNDTQQIHDIIENTTFNNEKILKEYFKTNNKIEEQVESAKTLIDERLNQLNKEFKAIEIGSQNVISLFSYPNNIESHNYEDLNLDKIIEFTKLNNKRVMDLIT